MGQSGSRVRKVFAACCWTELVLGIVGFTTVIWIKNSGINTNVKDFILGIIGALYFILCSILGVAGISCESSCLLIHHASCAILSAMICSAVTCLYLIDDTNLSGFKRASESWQNNLIVLGSLLMTVCFCLSILGAYWVRNGIIRGAVIKSRVTSPTVISGTQQGKNYGMRIPEFEGRERMERGLSPHGRASQRNHLETRSVISFRPPSARQGAAYSRLENIDRPESRISIAYRAEGGTFDRSESRLSRRSLGPPRPPPPRSPRPESPRVETTDLSRLGSLDREMVRETSKRASMIEEETRKIKVEEAKKVLEEEARRSLEETQSNQSEFGFDPGTEKRIEPIAPPSMPVRIIHKDASVASFKHSTHHVPSGRITSGPSMDTLDNILYAAEEFSTAEI